LGAGSDGGNSENSGSHRLASSAALPWVPRAFVICTRYTPVSDLKQTLATSAPRGGRGGGRGGGTTTGYRPAPLLRHVSAKALALLDVKRRAPSGKVQVPRHVSWNNSSSFALTF
jgi:hypothetical protein